MRKTILLIVLALALGAYVYFYEIKGGEERQQQKAAAEKLFHFNKDSVAQVHIHSLFSDFTFNKTADGWEIEQPLKTRADETPLNTLLSTMNSVKKLRTFTVQKDKQTNYGLGRQAWTISVSGKSGLLAQVKIGEATSVGSNVYVSTEDSIVAMIPSALKKNVQKSLFDWRDKKAVHFDRDKLREVHLHTMKHDYVFLKEGIRWKMTKPLQTAADRSAVDALVNKLFYGKIKSVVSETSSNLKKYGLAKSAYRIELLSGKDKARQTVAFSKLKNNKAYGKNETRSYIFEVDESFMKPLEKSLFDFRDKSVVTFEKKDADSLNLAYNGQTMAFRKDTTNSWVFAGGARAKGWKITNVFSALSNLKAAKFVSGHSLHRYGLDKPAGRFAVFAGEKKLAELLIGKTEDKLVYAINNLSGVIVAFEKTKLDSLFPKRSDLVEKPKAKTAESSKTGETR